ncbi:MAG: NAD-dependent DNA ligase LigA, partial [Prevotella sp.]|nr:NAD-dependent DNA ligase LigA [Prevotella sp.]
MTDTERIEDLRRSLHEANYRYYVLNAPTMSDMEFDYMMHELEALERKHPESADPNSPTQRVGSDLQAGFVQTKHRRPMLSLANTYSEEDIRTWYEQVKNRLGGEYFEVCCELKYDGLSIAITYVDGALERAVTRGDGEWGDDVTLNVRTIKSIPLRLPEGNWPREFEVRGEVLMPWDSFNHLNKKRAVSGGTLFANPRNAAAGTLKLQVPRNVAKRRLDAYIYYLLCDELPTDNHYENILTCADWGFKTSIEMKKAGSIEDIMQYIDYWETERKKLPFATDGIVLKVNSIRQQGLLGETAKAPRWAIAYKYKAESARTQLISVDYQVGRTGAVTPVANMRPVQLSGTVVRRATLNNADYIKSLDLHIGDFVYIEKGGEIIPKIVGVDAESRTEDAVPVEFTTHCPACNA